MAFKIQIWPPTACTVRSAAPSLDSVGPHRFLPREWTDSLSTFSKCSASRVRRGACSMSYVLPWTLSIRRDPTYKPIMVRAVSDDINYVLDGMS